MKKLKILLTFTKLAIIEKINFFRNVLEKMENNPLFPSPDVSYPDAVLAVNKLEEAQLAAIDGSRTAIATMHKVDVETDEVFRKLADYVNRVCDGDEASLLSSGFDISKEPAPRQIHEFSVKPGEKPGTVVMKRQAIPGAKSYLWQKAAGELPQNDEGWSLAGVSTQASIEINGLASAQRYWFRVAGITPDGQGIFSLGIPVVTQ